MKFLLLLSMLGFQEHVLDDLVKIRKDIEMINTLVDHGLEVDKDGVIVSSLLVKAKEISKGDIVDYKTLVEKTGADNVVPLKEEQAKGWITFTNIVLVLAAIMVLSALTMLFGHYFLYLILLIPIKAWSVGVWAICIGLVQMSKSFGDNSLLLAIPGVFGMIGCCFLSHEAHFKGFVSKENSFRVFTLILAFAWGATAIYINSHFIGFMAVASMMSFLGFSFSVFPGFVSFGFTDEDVVPRVTFASGAIFGLHLLLMVTGSTAQSFEVFREGMSGLGSFVFYLGLLIMACKWYSYKNQDLGGVWRFRIDLRRYLLLQIPILVAGVFALWFGSVYKMPSLLAIGGTFFCLYIIEKYYEIPWKGIGYAWSALGLGVMLYYFSVFANIHPEYFIFMGK
jgi:hypothetical protein